MIAEAFRRSASQLKTASARLEGTPERGRASGRLRRQAVRTTRLESILNRTDCQVADTATAQGRPMSAMPEYNVTGLYDVDGRDVLAGR